MESLKKSGDFDDTLIMTFSEFGRRVKENGSMGTDHGKANNVFLIGSNLKNPGVFNGAPNLRDLDAGDVVHQVDFRNIYQDLIQDWFGKSSKSIISKTFKPLEII